MFCAFHLKLYILVNWPLSRLPSKAYSALKAGVVYNEVPLAEKSAVWGKRDLGKSAPGTASQAKTRAITTFPVRNFAQGKEIKEQWSLWPKFLLVTIITAVLNLNRKWCLYVTWSPSLEKIIRVPSFHPGFTSIDRILSLILDVYPSSFITC